MWDLVGIFVVCLDNTDDLMRINDPVNCIYKGGGKRAVNLISGFIEIATF